MRTAQLAIAALVGSLFIGCGQGAGVPADISDRQIFEGAVFGAGPVATLLREAREQLRPELYVRNPETLSAMAEARAAIIDELELEYPGFVARFAAAARSGDPAQVRAMLARAMIAVPAALDALRSSGANTGQAPQIRDEWFNVPIGSKTQAPSIKDEWFNVPIGSKTQAPTIKDEWFNVPIGSKTQAPSIKDEWFNVPIGSRTQGPSLRDIHPGWDRFTSSLLADQLAASIADTFGPSASGR